MGPVAGSRPVGWLGAEHIASSPGSQRLPLHHAALSVDSAFFGCRVGCELFTDTPCLFMVGSSCVCKSCPRKFWALSCEVHWTLSTAPPGVLWVSYLFCLELASNMLCGGRWT